MLSIAIGEAASEWPPWRHLASSEPTPAEAGGTRRAAALEALWKTRWKLLRVTPAPLPGLGHCTPGSSPEEKKSIGEKKNMTRPGAGSPGKVVGHVSYSAKMLCTSDFLSAGNRL